MFLQFTTSERGKARWRIVHANATQGDRTVLVFERYGSQYFLSEIRIAGNNLSYKLPEAGGS